MRQVPARLASPVRAARHQPAKFPQQAAEPPWAQRLGSGFPEREPVTEARPWLPGWAEPVATPQCPSLTSPADALPGTRPSLHWPAAQNQQAAKPRAARCPWFPQPGSAAV